MRKSIRNAAVLGTSVALVAGFALGSADAATGKELNLCWDSSPGLPALDADITADGPSFRQRHFDGGECRAYSVRPGQYKIQLENYAEILDAITPAFTPPQRNAICGSAEPVGYDWDIDLIAKIRRFDKTYRTQVFALANPEAIIISNVKQDRRTTVAFDIRCSIVNQ